MAARMGGVNERQGQRAGWRQGSCSGCQGEMFLMVHDEMVCFLSAGMGVGRRKGRECMEDRQGEQLLKCVRQ